MVLMLMESQYASALLELKHAAIKLAQNPEWSIELESMLDIESWPQIKTHTHHGLCIIEGRPKDPGNFEYATGWKAVRFTASSLIAHRYAIPGFAISTHELMTRVEERWPACQAALSKNGIERLGDVIEFALADAHFASGPLAALQKSISVVLAPVKRVWTRLRSQYDFQTKRPSPEEVAIAFILAADVHDAVQIARLPTRDRAVSDEEATRKIASREAKLRAHANKVNAKMTDVRWLTRAQWQGIANMDRSQLGLPPRT
jgi:hypothetical protein